MILPVILSGGAGTRLWPLSTDQKPKQFWNLLGSRSLLQNTVLRLKTLSAATPLFIANKKHVAMLEAQLAEINLKAPSILLEPIGKNTAPAITIAALAYLDQGADPTLLVLPADHLIANTKTFLKIIKQASVHAEKGYLITFGICPSRPETGYGYIKAGKKWPGDSIHKVDRFVEKPSEAKARQYCSSGLYYWNSGIFLFKASVYLDQIQKFRPDIFSACQKTLKYSKSKGEITSLSNRYFSQCPSESIDYAVMEKTDRAAVIPADIGWSDIGSWQSLFDLDKKDSQENVTHGNIITQDSKNSYLRAEHRQLITLGVKNLIVVETKDAILILHKDHSQNIKSVIQKMRG